MICLGHVVEWDMSNGELVERKVHGTGVSHISLSGDKIVTCDISGLIRVFIHSTCLSGSIIPVIILADRV